MINYKDIEIEFNKVSLTKNKYEALIRLTCNIGDINEQRPEINQPSLANVFRAKIIDEVYPEIKDIYSSALMDAINIDDIAKTIRYKLINAAVRGDL